MLEGLFDESWIVLSEVSIAQLIGREVGSESTLKSKTRKEREGKKERNRVEKTEARESV